MPRKLPETMNNNIVTQKSANELLIYNTKSNQAICLNETATAIYEYCSSNKSFEDLKADYNFSDDLIYLGLNQLAQDNLIEASGESVFNLVSRRELVRKIGLTSMVVLPLVSSIVAPSAANAASRCVNPGGIAPGEDVGSRNWTTRGRVCQFPDPVIDRNCGTTFGSQCCSGNAVQDECNLRGGFAVYNCKCA